MNSSDPCMILGCFEWFLMILGPSNLFWINISKLCANFQEFLEVKDSLANSNGRLERRMEVHKTSIKMGKSNGGMVGVIYRIIWGLMPDSRAPAEKRPDGSEPAWSSYTSSNFSSTVGLQTEATFFSLRPWVQVGPGWACLRPILGPCCAYVGPM